MRTGITVTGLIVLLIGLVIAGAAFYYINVAGEWLGGIVSVLGLITGVAGLYAKKPPT